MSVGKAVVVSALLAIGGAFGDARGRDAADPVALRSLFPNEADVFVDGPGLVRIDLSAEVVAQCRPDLSNLRLFDIEGNEVPFLLDAPRRGVALELESIAAPPREVGREEIRRQGLPPLRRETYELAAPARQPRSGAWTLVLDSAQRTFVARVAIGPAASAATRHGSVFRLGVPRAVEKLRIPVPAGAGGRLQVVLEHEQESWLEPSFRFESTSALPFGSATSIPLPILSRHSADGTTVIELARPSGVVPEALRVASTTATFDRRIVVQDEGPVRDPAPLGSANIFRLLPDTDVEELEIPIRPARGDRLNIVIEDGDSPPLAGLTVAAVFAKPSLVASLNSPGGASPAGILCFGGGRARVPRYDLAGLIPQPGREVYGRRAEALLRLYDPSSVGGARLGPVRANPTFDPSPFLAFAMRPGAAIDQRSWAMRRSLAIPASDEGLSRLRLSPDDLAALHTDLADLRIVDGEGRQWPYLVDRDAGLVEVPLTISERGTTNRATTYRLDLPDGALAIQRLRLDFEAPFFDRPFRLVGRADGGEERLLGEGRLARRAGDRAVTSLSFGDVPLTSLELRIEDGDDAPLTLRGASGEVEVADVFVAAPAGSYWVLLGGGEAPSPRYEIERVRDVVLAVEAVSVEAGAAEPNPRHNAAARLIQGKGREQVLLWVVVIAAVVILAALTFRLTRR